MTRSLLPAGVALLLSVSGCSSVEVFSSDEEIEVAAVWADDTAEIAVVIDRIVREPNAIGERLIVDKTYEVVVVPPDGAGERALTVGRSGSVSRAFYMRRAGYVLAVGTRRDAGGASRAFEEIIRDGGEVVALEGLGRGHLPSPDGARLAFVAAADCPHDPARGGGVLIGERCFVAIGVRDAATLEASGPPIALRFATTSPSGALRVPSMQWRPDGALVVATEAEAFAIASDGTVEETAVPSCRWPATSSAEIAPDGRLVDARVEGGEVRIDVAPAGDASPWASCFPSD